MESLQAGALVDGGLLAATRYHIARRQMYEKLILYKSYLIWLPKLFKKERHQRPIIPAMLYSQSYRPAPASRVSLSFARQ